MRLGLLGPSDDDTLILREAAEFLLGDAEVDQIIYLGIDGAMERVVAQWGKEIMEGGADEAAFLARAADLAQRGGPDEIEALLSADAHVQKLANIRTLPPAPARAVEMMADRIVLVVHDKAVLDEDDIANSTVIVYGKSDDMLLKKIGPRYFFTPGPLSKRRVAVLETEDDETGIVIAVFDPSGAPLWRELLPARTTRVQVST
jgi:hypothetical protein